MQRINLFTQRAVLKKCFDGFCQDGSIHVDTIGTILTMMGLRVKPSALKEIIEEVDEDGSGYLEFEEFCSLRLVLFHITPQGAPRDFFPYCLGKILFRQGAQKRTYSAVGPKTD